MTLSLFMMLSFVEPVTAQMVDVTVNIEEIEALSELSGTFGTDEPDFYVTVFIRHLPMTNAEHVLEFENQDHLEDLNWEFTRTLDISSNEIIPIDIFLHDANWGLGSADKLIDIGRGSAAVGLHMVLNPTDCTISVTPDTLVTANSVCNSSIVSEGQETGDHAKIKVSINAEPSLPELGTLSCNHSPIWPDVDDRLEITTRYSEPALENILWVNNKTNEIIHPSSDPENAMEAWFQTAPLAAEEFRYKCGVTLEDRIIESEWREISVGDFTNSNTNPHIDAIPISVTGTTLNSLDIVFVPDDGSIVSIEDGRFLNMITNYTNTFLKSENWVPYQDHFNFWIAPDFGTVKPFTLTDGPNGCGSTIPANWNEDYTWADTGVLAHFTGDWRFRDCAFLPEFSTIQLSGGSKPDTLAHELGHSLFGLADEYCDTRPGSNSTVCDGGYFQNDPNPNLYANLDDCNANPTKEDRDCQEIVPNHIYPDWFGFWYTSDPPVDDLMVDNKLIQPLDDRRINYIIDRLSSMGGLN